MKFKVPASCRRCKNIVIRIKKGKPYKTSCMLVRCMYGKEINIT